MGRMIVIDGLDGSGKATQAEMLKNRLKEKGYDIFSLDLPYYDDPSSTLVRMYLSGELGDNPGDVNCFAASTFFGVDRYASYKTGIGKKIVDGTATMAELEAYALEMGDVTTNISGRQEYLENIMNSIMFA